MLLARSVTLNDGGAGGQAEPGANDGLHGELDPPGLLERPEGHERREEDRRWCYQHEEDGRHPDIVDGEARPLITTRQEYSSAVHRQF